MINRRYAVTKNLLLTLLIALTLVLSIALSGCTCNPASEDNNADVSSESGPAPAAAKVPQEWQGAWRSESEVLPPETYTRQYELNIEANGSFTLTESDAVLYTGIIDITNQPSDGWADATLDGKTIKLQLVNNEGTFELTFNAEDNWDQSLKRIIFQRR